MVCTLRVDEVLCVELELTAFLFPNILLRRPIVLFTSDVSLPTLVTCYRAYCKVEVGSVIDNMLSSHVIFRQTRTMITVGYIPCIDPCNDHKSYQKYATDNSP